jgi:hypothetical protein
LYSSIAVFQTNDHAEKYFVVTVWSLGGRTKSLRQQWELCQLKHGCLDWSILQHTMFSGDVTITFQEQLKAPTAAGPSHSFFANSQLCSIIKASISFCALEEKL